ncbi:hypothetical protein ACLIA0_05030 [Bacillaceae bacterium W0354]
MKGLIIVGMIFVLTGCGLPKEHEISNNIKEGIKKIEQNSWDQSWDHSKNVEDYLHLKSYKYEKKHIYKMTDYLDEIENAISVLNKEKTIKGWNKVKRLWEKMK